MYQTPVECFSCREELPFTDAAGSRDWSNTALPDLQCLAQLGRALRSGCRGRWFKSSHTDQFIAA
jgi:hypothetical protein